MILRSQREALTTRLIVYGYIFAKIYICFILKVIVALEVVCSAMYGVSSMLSICYNSAYILTRYKVRPRWPSAKVSALGPELSTRPSQPHLVLPDNGPI
ncbi:hypothetical protein AVEN_178117-1 [Araneus ventricosus]|uniref:Uncharacterized protein n=1 Tax=Araneus ventricosus TaxID=182803 RepID=A0A4Y2MB23_ARAVE|nr:hypothetical protein AVEN_178117-1 [Araneus ventricosus]